MKVNLDAVEEHCRVLGAGERGLLLVGTRCRRDGADTRAARAGGDTETGVGVAARGQRRCRSALGRRLGGRIAGWDGGGGGGGGAFRRGGGGGEGRRGPLWERRWGAVVRQPACRAARGRVALPRATPRPDCSRM